MSSTGEYQTAVVYSGKIYISTDSGDTWTEKDSNRNWTSVAMSSTGEYQTAVVFSGKIYVSTDYGTNFTEKGSTYLYESVSISSSGQYQVAAGYLAYASSIDYGANWSDSLTSLDFRGIAVSGTYKFIIGAPYNYYIAKSVDYGASFNYKDSIRNWVGIAIKKDYSTDIIKSDTQYTQGNIIWYRIKKDSINSSIDCFFYDSNLENKYIITSIKDSLYPYRCNSYYITIGSCGNTTHTENKTGTLTLYEAIVKYDPEGTAKAQRNDYGAANLFSNNKLRGGL
jgi:hypothetical protein